MTNPELRAGECAANKMKLHFTKDALPDSVGTDFQNLNKLNEQVSPTGAGELHRKCRNSALTLAEVSGNAARLYLYGTSLLPPGSHEAAGSGETFSHVTIIT